MRHRILHGWQWNVMCWGGAVKNVLLLNSLYMYVYIYIYLGQQ